MTNELTLKDITVRWACANGHEHQAPFGDILNGWSVHPVVKRQCPAVVDGEEQCLAISIPTQTPKILMLEPKRLVGDKIAKLESDAISAYESDVDS